MQVSKQALAPSFTRLVAAQRLTLFRGIYAPIVFIGAWKALIFTSYEASLRGIQAAREQYGFRLGAARAGSVGPSMLDVCSAAAMSGLVGNLMAGPIDMVKCNAQALPRKPGTSMLMHEVHTARTLMTRGNHGARLPRLNFLALYYGVGIHIVFSSFTMAVWFGVNKWLKDEYTRLTHTDKPSFLTNVAIGGVAGSVSWLVAYPVDVMRTLRQTSLLKNGAWHNYRECYRLALAATGNRSFLWRGVGVTVSRGVLQCGVTMAVFDAVLDMLDSCSTQIVA